MPDVEITRSGDRAIAEQLGEMRDWLARAGIVPRELVAVRVVASQVIFRGTFGSTDEAARFARAFGLDRPLDHQDKK